MLKGTLIHPQILNALGRAGHGSQILIADGNFPFSTTLGRNSELVSLNLTPGVVSCTQVLESLASSIPIEAGAVMDTPRSGPFAQESEPEIWNEFCAILRGVTDSDFELDRIERFEFYRAVAAPSVALTIATGEQRIFANLLLTIGVVFPVGWKMTRNIAQGSLKRKRRNRTVFLGLRFRLEEFNLT